MTQCCSKESEVGAARASSTATTLVAMVELNKSELDELVEEAIVDAYGEDEQLTGFYTMIEENLTLPFATTILGVEVTVEDIDLTDSGIAAICIRGTHRQSIALLDLPLPAPPPPGSEWITATSFTNEANGATSKAAVTR